MRLDVIPHKGITLTGVLNDLPLRREHDGSASVELGDAYGGQTASVVLRFDGLHPRTPGPTEVAQLVLRFTPVGQGTTANAIR